MYGPIDKKRQDSAMLSESGLLDQIQQNSNDATGQPVCVYG